MNLLLNDLLALTATLDSHAFATSLKTRQYTHEHVANLHCFVTSTKSQIASFDTDSVDIICDTGACAGFTHCMSDYISFRPANGSVKGLGKHSIKGIGVVKYNIINDKGDLVTLTIRDVYFVPTLTKRLLSPQQVAAQHKKNGLSQYVGDDNVFKLYWNSNVKSINLSKNNNLPILQTAPGNEKATAFVSQVENNYTSPLCFQCTKTIDHYPLRDTIDENEANQPIRTSALVSEGPPTNDPHETIRVKCGKHCTSCTQHLPSSSTSFDLGNANALTDKQRTLLHWHKRLGHMSWKRLQDLAAKGYLGNKSLAKIKPPFCMGCQLGKAHRLSASSDGKIIGDWVKKPGDLIHMDQAETSQPGRAHTFSGKNPSEKINAFTVYVDSISKMGFVHFQQSTSADETLVGKHRFERYAHQRNVKLKSFRADNGVFRAAKFRMDIAENEQDITFAAVGAHHMNGVAERFIRTITERARTALLYASTRWDSGKIPTELWTYAVKHAVTTWNMTPRQDLNYFTPEEIFSGIKIRIDRATLFKQLHPFGCPAYVLQKDLSDGKKIPKWEPRTRTGIFLGYSDDHAKSVSLILNPDTDHISPQYNVVHDDDFHTCTTKTDSDTLAAWNDIWKTKDLTKEDFETEFEFEDYTNPPKVAVVPSSNSSRPSGRKRCKTSTGTHIDSGSTCDPQRETLSPQRESSHEQETLSQHDNAPRQSVLQRKQTSLRKHPRDLSTFSKQTKSSRQKKVPVRKRVPKRKRKTAKIIDEGISSFKATASPAQLRSFQAKVEKLDYLNSLANDEISELNVMAHIASANPNILGHRDAMKADDADKFHESMDEEIQRLTDENIYEVVARSTVPEGQRVLRAVWSHRRKTTPTGQVYRHRSRICVDGSQQTYGVDYKETYAPVVSWTSVRVMMIMSIIFDMKSRQVDYVQAFPQATLGPDEHIFMEIPDGFEYEGSASSNYVLKLKKNLYGLRQAAYNWNVMLTKGLLAIGFRQSKHDPCMFFKKDVVCCLYVDDTLIWSSNNEAIDETIRLLKEQNFVLTDEGQVDAFLGVKVDKLSDGSIKMPQPGLIDTILKLTGIEKDTEES